ncbi:alpha-glucoside transport system substrate-binding protein [Arcanobacterium wilhelmae]|uniref:Alpha-glucoside transport system substrate-binding protein n=1 Tax=Arcanobacterium wilhelmae TaxID=1803177 RepID=A0ABT9NB90_9ACTO|nr:ABC transporter substrate-binding protein [Arcanobacterium wilhelmae]MDP9800793.1 alpha-glucoside transport system substrate-binding protein [Arcanobacterium wilhelmae]
MKRATSLAALVATTALLAACGGTAPNTTSSSASGAPATEVKGDYPDLTGETISVASDWSGAEQENFQKVLDGFAKATGAKVTYTSLGNNVATALGTQIEGGKPPSVALIPQPGLLKQLAAKGSIKPLSAEVSDAVAKNYAQTWADLSTVDDKNYGVWFKAANKSTIWYNTKLYEEAGATAPATWEDFTKTLKTLSDSGYAGISIGADVGWPLTDWFENVYLRTAGPEKYDQLTEHKIPWTDPSVKEALDVLSKLWGDSALIQPGGAQRTFPDSVTAVFGEKPAAATVYEGDFVAGNITSQTKSKVGTDAKLYPWPSINGSKPSVMGAGNVAVAFDENKGTQALMKYLASPEAANTWIALGGFTSPNKNADMNLYPDEISRQIADELVNAEVFKFDMSDLVPSAFGGTEGQGMWQIFIDFYQKPADVEGTMAALEKAATEAYK